MSQHIHLEDLEHAIASMEKSYKDGTLHEWVHEHLMSEENTHLAESMRSAEIKFVDLIEYPIHKLKKFAGVVEESKKEPLDVWEKRVNVHEKILDHGMKLLPFIVTDLWNPMEIVDGNHRHEALVRRGIDKFWTIFFLKNDHNIDDVKSHKLPVTHTS